MSKIIEQHDQFEKLRNRVINSIDSFIMNIELLEKWLSK